MVNTSYYKNSTEETDEVLAEKSRNDEFAYANLVGRYEKKLMRYIMRIGIFTKEDAEEILQEVFIKAYENIEDFDSRLKFSSWIYRIAHNEAVSRIRHDASRNILSHDEFDELADKIADETSFEDHIDKKILAEEVRTIIRAMDQKYRDVIILRFLENKEYQEISDILKKPPGTVATLLNRAKEKLKKEVASHPTLSSLWNH